MKTLRQSRNASIAGLRSLPIVCIAIAVLLLQGGCATGGASAGPQVQATVSLQLTNRPRLRLIPGLGVYYGLDVPARYYFFGRHYWVHEQGFWFRGRFYNGPWVRVPEHRVPDPLLRLPPPYRPQDPRPGRP